MAVGLTLWAAAAVVRSVVRFALLPSRGWTMRPEPSRLSAASYKLASRTVDAALVVVPAAFALAYALQG